MNYKCTPHLFATAAICAAAVVATASAQAQATFKLGVVTFLSGPAAESFGVPAANGAKLMVDQFNRGAAPAPFNRVGFGGMNIEMVLVDEAGGAAKQVQEMRNLYQLKRWTPSSATSVQATAWRWRPPLKN